MALLAAGIKAPAFSLLDQEGNKHTLAQQKGKWVVLYFYPKDSTPGCTIEACQMRDQSKLFAKINTVVFGVSADSVASHKKFATNQKLSFTLLSDPEKKTIEDYGVWAKKKFMGRAYMGILRVTYLIDPKGKIAKVYETVKPLTHAQEVYEDIKKME